MADTKIQITDEKVDELRPLVEQLRLIDDTFFEKVMEDKDVCEEVIRIIMEDPGLSIREVNPQESVHNLQGRSVRLDVLCERSDGAYINVELQRADNDDHFKRVRYHASCITANVTEPGERFKNVRDVCVIYISEFDIFKRGKTIYHVSHVVKETEGEVDPVYVDDGFTSIYVNTAIDDKTEIAELMNCFLQTKVDNPKFPKLSNRVAQFKEDEEGVREMCAIVEEYANKKVNESKKEWIKEGKREGIEIGKAEGIIKSLRKYNVPNYDIREEIQNQLEIPEEDAQRYIEMFTDEEYKFPNNGI